MSYNFESLEDINKGLEFFKEEMAKLKRHFERLEELYSDVEDIVIGLDARANKLQEASPKTKIRNLEEENKALKNKIQKYEHDEKELAKDIRALKKETTFDALDILDL